MMRRIASILAGLCVVGAFSTSASAQPRSLGADDVVMMTKPYNAWLVVVRNFIALQRRQQRGPASLLVVPPRDTGGTGRRWLPPGPIGLPPPGMAVGPLPWKLFEVAPMIIETANTNVATGRGNEGMLAGPSVSLPWLVP
jgi:hypothetical protein